MVGNRGLTWGTFGRQQPNLSMHGEAGPSLPRGPQKANFTFHEETFGDVVPAQIAGQRSG